MAGTRRSLQMAASDRPKPNYPVPPAALSRTTRAQRRTAEAAAAAASSMPLDGAPTTSSSSTALSSVPTPTGFGSDVGYDTPLTTNGNTPNSGAMPGSLQDTFQSAQHLTIELPGLKPPPASALPSTLAQDSMKSLSKSKYALNSRKKTIVMDDSDDDNDEEEDDLFTRDAEVARQLQVEQDRAFLFGSAGGSPETGQSSAFALRAALASVQSSQEGIDDDSDPVPILAMLGKKRRKLTQGRSTHRGTPASYLGFPRDMSDDDADLLSLTSMSSFYGEESVYDSGESVVELADDDGSEAGAAAGRALMNHLGTRRQYRNYRSKKRVLSEREKLEKQHPVLLSMWKDLENMPTLNAGRADQPASISRNLKPFQLEGLAWLKAMETTHWRGGLLGDEMGLGKTIQAVSLIMSDYPAKKPTLVLVPPVALMQWVSEITSYTDGRLKTFVFHGTNAKSKKMTVKDVKQYDVIIMSYNSLESMFRRQEKGFVRKEGIYKEQSVIHQTSFHRAILDEAHCIKTRSTMTAKACFALNVDYRWCLTGTPLQNRIGEFFSLLRFLEVSPFASYICRDCPCSRMEWSMNDDNTCTGCRHRGMRHVSVFNQELLNPIQRYGNRGPGTDAFKKLRLLTSRIMLRRLKKDHTDSMELPVKEINVDRQFFSEVETDFADSIMTNTQRKFNTYVANGVMLNNYANIFGLIMQMRQVADHPDLILKKNSEGSQNVMICCICDEPAEEAIRSKCKHDFCRECAKSYVNATEQPDCPRCHISLSIDLEQPEMEQDELMVKKSSIINRIRMENWTSSSKIELLVCNLHQLRSEKASHKSIIFSQFTTMLQLIEWRLRRAGITTVMLDGSMTPAQRQASIDYFKNNVDVECFLVSLKAGGVALNLTEASRVFIVDPWWNPAAEWQSADRCHRIGQTRPCVVTRLCIEDSVESRMVLLQEKKTRMINSTINSDDAAMESLTPEDLQFLFRGS